MSEKMRQPTVSTRGGKRKVGSGRAEAHDLAIVNGAGRSERLRKLLTEAHDWSEQALQKLSVVDGYGHLPRSIVHLCAHIGREPVLIADLARMLGTSRQWIAKQAHEGRELGILEMIGDEKDKRAVRVGFSEQGWAMVRKAVARMDQIEAELARRIGEKNLRELIRVLALDWGPPDVSATLETDKAHDR